MSGDDWWKRCMEHEEKILELKNELKVQLSITKLIVSQGDEARKAAYLEMMDALGLDRNLAPEGIDKLG